MEDEIAFFLLNVDVNICEVLTLTGTAVDFLPSVDMPPTFNRFIFVFSTRQEA
jgi:hypothetical protein